VPAQPELLIGTYFIATFPHWDGRVEAMIDAAHYLVRFEAGSDGSPEALFCGSIGKLIAKSTTCAADRAIIVLIGLR
jgi:hypothetical protein